MKDAYSFDMDADGLEASYQKMRTAYRKIFDRCGLDTIPVKADTGAMGGSESEEFMVASEVGEEVLLLCGSCGYRANREKAGFQRLAAPAGTSPIPLEAVETPGVKSIDDLVKFFGADADSFMKSLVYLCDGKPVMAVVPGSREINEHKLKNFLKAAELELAPDNIVEEVTGAPVGFAGPVGAKARVIFDISVKDTVNGITGANKIDLHYRGVNPGRDFQIKEEADISSAREGDMCPECGAPMYEKKGIEVGHIFKLGYKYTKSMGLTVLDEKGQEVTPIMGCYGIGVNRTMAAVVEQNSDAKGIMWPKEVAPFQVHLVGIAKTDEEFAAIEEIYSGMKSAGIDCIYDDRKASPGIKFADADLIGIPVRVTAGKGFFASGEVEVKLRSETSFVPVKSGELIGFLKEKGLV
jgi:prolyl-tRNA synthetase